MLKRFTLALTSALTLSIASPTAWSAGDNQTFKLAFGSCAQQEKDQPIWTAVNKEQADVFVFLGDNVYADTDKRDRMRAAWNMLGNKPGFKALRQSDTKIMATWDDHDYGAHDGGGDFHAKEMAREEFLRFFKEPEDSKRWTQETGINSAEVFRQGDKTIQVILLDTRFNRSPITAVTDEEYKSVRKPAKRGKYKAVSEGTMLGEAQWKWLEAQLNQPADYRIIGSSIQLVAEFTGWESWANKPHERQRFFDLLKKTKANGVVLISGDVHRAEVSQLNNELSYPLWEVNQ